MTLSTRALKVLASIGAKNEDELNRFLFNHSPEGLLKYRGCGTTTLFELMDWSKWHEFREQEIVRKECEKCITYLREHGYSFVLSRSKIQ